MKKELAARGEGFKLRKKPSGIGAKRPRHDGENDDHEEPKKRIAITAGDSSRSKTFSTGRFHDLGLAETVADHLHGEKLFPLLDIRCKGPTEGE